MASTPHPALSSLGAAQRLGRMAQRTALCALALLLSACATTHPWINRPIASATATPASAPTATGAAGAAPQASTAHPDAPPPAPTVEPAAYRGSADHSPSIIAAVTLSGGGARAAAFGLGVLRGLKDTRFTIDGRQTTLLDEVGLISGVSGGSVLATYYAAFGDQVFTRFDHDFLLADFQSSLIGYALSPATLYRMSSPWYGRSNALADKLDRVYRGMTFGDLRRLHDRPRLLVTATDLTTGAPFEFTPEQFGLICSDFNSVPLSFAVASSSSVPILLSPMTLQNHAGSCPESHLAEDGDAESNLSARLRHLIAQSYLDAAARPYIHLVDGGLADNLGVRGLIDKTLASGSLDAFFRTLPPGSVHRIVLVSVNSERDTADRIDTSDRVPSMPQVLDSLVFGAGTRLTTETTEMVNDAARRMTEELQADRLRPGSPFAADAEIHVITVSLRGLRDEQMRHKLLQVPTALTILPIQVRQLEKAGRQALWESAEFQQLRQSLGAQTLQADGGGDYSSTAPDTQASAPATRSTTRVAALRP